MWMDKSDEEPVKKATKIPAQILRKQGKHRQFRRRQNTGSANVYGFVSLTPLSLETTGSADWDRKSYCR